MRSASRPAGARPGSCGNALQFPLSLAISTALFAVIAAIASLEAGNYANEALFQANKAALKQTQAVDTWSEFQADSVKKYQQQTLVTILPHVGGTAAEIQRVYA